MSKHTYVILGMHRSGTSFIAKALNDMGVNMGSRLLPANKWNPQGHFENLDFVELNTDILEKAGGSWRDVPTDEAVTIAGDKFREAIKEVIKKSKDDLWGVKDPRFTLTANLFLPHLMEEEDLYLVCIFRKPKKVAESLKRRSGLPLDKGLNLARQYNERIIKVIKNFLGV